MFPAGVSYGESKKIESTLSDTQVVETRNSKRGNACRNLTAIRTVKLYYAATSKQYDLVRGHIDFLTLP